MFDVDWSSVLNWLMHPLLRTDFNLRFLNAVASPFKTLYNAFIIYRESVNYKLSHSGQVCFLEGYLNDTFDIDQRRITITDSGQAVIIILTPDSYQAPIKLNPDESNSITSISNDAAYAGSSYDFIVTVPFVLSDSEQYQLKGIVNYYKLAGKRYRVLMNK